MNEIKNIVLGTQVEELERVLSPFIEEQFPSFVKTDYRKLVLFIKAYYEWCDKKGNAAYVLNNLQTVYDVDQNADEFYSHFKNTYLSGFVDTLATNTAGNKPNNAASSQPTHRPTVQPRGQPTRVPSHQPTAGLAHLTHSFLYYPSIQTQIS